MINLIKGALVGLVVGALSAFFFARDYYRADTEIAALKSIVATRDFDIRMAQDAAMAAAKRAVSLEQEAVKNQDSINELEREIEARLGRDACRLDDADARRLRSIR